MVGTSSDEGGEVLKLVLPNALERTFDEVTRQEGQGTLTPSGVRDSWIRCLRDAFHAFYEAHPGPRQIAVFGGTPRPGEDRAAGVPTGIPGWSRWEFLHDVAVVEWDRIPAAYAKDPLNSLEQRPIPIVTKALWQVESEIAGDGTQVAEDLSKLRVCAAENKLLVASFTGQHTPDRWLAFLACAMSGTDGNLFIAQVPNYGNPRGYAAWRAKSANLRLYRCSPDGPEMVSLLRSTPAVQGTR